MSQPKFNFKRRSIIKDERDSNLENNFPLEPLKSVKKTKVGYHKIADQLYKKYQKTDYRFNLMVLGSSGLGKSTLLNSLFRTNFPVDADVSTTGITENEFLLEENDVSLNLKIIRYPDFNDKIDNSNCCSVIETYLATSFQKQFNLEYKAEFSKNDHLVHVCLYFLQPYNNQYCLRELDIQILKATHNKMNIIPLIAKADTMTPLELEKHKSNLLKEIKEHQLNCFQFILPQDIGWKALSAPDLHKNHRLLLNLIEKYPFAVVGSNETVINNERNILVRTYPWGEVEVDNLNHCDTTALRTLLLSTHLQILIDSSRQNHYGAYVSNLLSQTCKAIEAPDNNVFHPAMFLENVKKYHQKNLDKKINETDQGFHQLVSKKQKDIEELKQYVEEGIQLLDADIQQAEREYDALFQKHMQNKSMWSEHNNSVTTLNSMTGSTSTLKKPFNNPFKTLTRIRK